MSNIILDIFIYLQITCIYYKPIDQYINIFRENIAKINVRIANYLLYQFYSAQRNVGYQNLDPLYSLQSLSS